MVKVGLVGLGKMGLSHAAIVRTHPQVDHLAVCDGAKYLTQAIAEATGLPTYSSLDDMLSTESLDALLVATPSTSHAVLVRKALDRGLHVFCEKPFVLDPVEGEELIALAEQNRLVNQVGYHYRFVGAFQEAARVVRSGALGDVHHIRAEAYGPVVLRPQGGTWRLQKNAGGGALYDYACHAIDLANSIMGPPASVDGVVRHSVFSRDVEDEVYCTLHYPRGASGQLSVNWSDDSHRKMSTKVTVWGTNGRLTADRQECQVYLRRESEQLPGYTAGWTVKYTTELTDEVWFYLRGEEYSAQIDHFISNVSAGRTDGTNTFRSAIEADRVARSIMHPEHQGTAALPVDPRRRESWWRRLVGRRRGGRN
jgi:predicted dehydrogenase